MKHLQFAAFLLVAFLPASALEYRYEKAPPGFVPYAINDAGVMAGAIGDNAAILENGVVRQIGSWMWASGINSAGTVSLWSWFGRSYVYADGAMQEISLPNARSITAADIDDHGRIVGSFSDYAFPWARHAFVWDAGAIQVFDHPEFDGDLAHVISIWGCSSVGDIVGAYAGENGLQGFRYRGGVFLPTPTIRPMDINDPGQIVGIRNVDSVVFDPTGETSTISFPGAALTASHSIDNLGRVVGYYQLPYPDSNRYGFLAVPLIPIRAVAVPRQLPSSAAGALLVTLYPADDGERPDCVRAEIDQVNGHDLNPVSPEGAVREGAGQGNTREGITYRFDARALAPDLSPGTNIVRIVCGLANGRLLAGHAEVEVPSSK